MSTVPETAEVPEVDIEVGLIIGCTCCSLEMDEDDLDVVPEEAADPES